MTTSRKGLLGAGFFAAGLAILTACGTADPPRSKAEPPSSTTSGLPAVATSVGGPNPTEPPAPTVPVRPATTRAPAAPSTLARTAAVKVLVRGAGFCTHLPATPSPECDPRPLPGVPVVVRDAGGATVARGLTDESGIAALAVPPGAHVVSSDPVPGFSEAARPAQVDVRPGETVEIVLTHNTGFQ